MSGMEIPAAAALIGAGATAYGTVAGVSAGETKKQAGLMAASEQSKAYEFEQSGYQRQATQIKSAAAADEAKRRDDLVSSLDTIQVMRAGRGLDLDSPTGRAISAGVTDTAERNIATSKSNYAQQAANSELAAALAGRKARYALIAGQYGAAADDASIDATIASGVGKIAGLGLSLSRPYVPRTG